MKGTNIGEFEELVLLTIGSLYPEAYGVAIKKELKKFTGRNVTLSTVHSALNRLENKGLVTNEMGEATKMRGGKRKKYFTITSSGVRALTDMRSQREMIWGLIPEAAFKASLA